MTQQAHSAEDKYIDDMEQDVARIKEATVKSFLKPDWYIVSLHRGLIQDYTFLQNVLRAQERVDAIRAISPVIYDVRAHFPVWGRTISSLKGLNGLDTDEFYAAMMPLDAVGAQFVYYEGEIYLTSAYRFETPDSFSIVIRLDKQEIGNTLKKLNSMEGAMTLLLRKDTGEILASSGAPYPAGPPVALPAMEQPSGAVTAEIGGRQYICVYRSSAYLGFTLVTLLPAADLYKPLEIYYVLMIIFTGIVLLTIASFIFYVYRVVGRPIKRLMRAFESMEKGDFGVRLVPDAQDEFAYLYTSFDHMAENTEHLISEVYEKGLLVERARLKHLQAQINPHFLYNSFYTLHRMIKIGDIENAEIFSAKLGKYFQYVTRDAEDAVALKTEAEHAGTYADIMSVRYGGAVSIEAGSLPAGWENLRVPRLILQPLIENAFEHGMKQRTGKGIVRISFTADGDRLYISVDDNGNGMDEEELHALNARISDGQGISEITGLANIHRRVRLTFGEGSGIAVSQSELGGTRVTLTLQRPAEDKA
jgi:two-component system sensor histidine kinase YesM